VKYFLKEFSAKEFLRKNHLPPSSVKSQTVKILITVKLRRRAGLRPARDLNNN